MKTINKLLVINLFFLTIGMNKLSAQDDILPSDFFNFSWQMSVPLSGMDGWISDPTYNGMCFEGAAFLTKEFAVGGEISGNYSYQKFSSKTLNFENDNFEGAITGVQYRTSRIIPTLLKGYYLFGDYEMVKPYASIGLGFAYMENNLAAGVYLIEDTGWGFSSNAEIGARFIFPGSNFGIITSAKYNYSNIKLAGIDNNNLSRLNFNAGISFLLDN